MEIIQRVFNKPNDMKSIVAFLIFIFFFTQSGWAKIWRVNNNLGISADYTNLSTAINDVANVLAGDTLMVEGSATGYGNITVTRKLIIIGAGYFLTENSPAITNPKTQANPKASILSAIYFNTGSAGSVLEGVTSDVAINESSITIERNKIGTLYILYSSNANIVSDTIRQNYITHIQTTTTSGTASNLLIYNNIIEGYGAYYGSHYSNFSGYYINNIFLASAGYPYACSNFTFQNNIFNGANFGAYLSSNAFFNNVEAGNSLPSGDGNIHGENLNNIFNGFSDITGFSSDGRYMLKTGSHAIGAGSLNGITVDCGVFGGPAPYVLSGMPAIPSIYSLTVPTSVPSGATNMNISVSSTTVH